MWWRVGLLTCFLLSGLFAPGVRHAAAAPAAGPVVTGIVTNLADYPDGRVPRYEKLEVSLTLAGSYANPFDPAQIRVDGVFTTPGGAVLVQPGFYYQAYQLTTVNGVETYTPSASPVWKVRFSPREAGLYHYFIRLSDASGTTDTTQASFQVAASSNPGFISVSQKNSRYFEFDSGAPFIGLGLNVGWWQFENRRISTYNYYLSRMQEYQANLARVWMVNSGRDQDWILSIQDLDLGSSYNLEEAWAFDAILDLAHQKGVYFLLTLDDVNQYTYNWSSNVYSSDTGGPCAYRSAIFTDTEARRYQERIFRYIVARWGYSPNILSWELFNEIDELQWSDQGHWDWGAVIDWHQEMAQYIRSIDAHRHLVNTSTGSFKTHPDLYGLPELGFAEMHFYYVPGCCDYAASDPAGRDMADLTRYYAHLAYGSVSSKPGIIGEWGLLNQGWGPSPYLEEDSSGVHLHNGLWSALMSGMAATGLSWHWDYHHQHDPAWWQHYRPLARFFQGIEVPNLAVMKPLNVSFDLPGGADNRPNAFSSTNSSLRILGLRSGDWIYAWMQNKNNTWWNATHAIQPGAQSGTVTIYNLTPGRMFIVEWWDTYTDQQVTNTQVLAAQANGSLILAVSNLEKDIAIKVHPVINPRLWLSVVMK
jgi:hypothetical protein